MPADHRPRRVLHALVILLIPFAFSLLADRGLTFLGIPTEVPWRVVHPPNFANVRKSIEFTYEFRTNSQGLRYREIPLSKPAGTRRIVVVGDSFVEGEGVRDEDRFTNLLETGFSRGGPEVDFVNAGLSGTAPLEYGRAFLAVGTRYQPDGLLVCISANDVFGTPADAAPANLYRPTPRRSGVNAVLHALWPRTYTLLREAKLGRIRQREEELWHADPLQYSMDEARQHGIPQARIDGWRAALPPDLVAAARRGEFNATILGHGLLHPTFWTDSLDIASQEAEAKWRAMAGLLTEIVRQARERKIRVGVVFVPDDMQYDARRFDAAGRNPWREAGARVDSRWLTGRSEAQRRLDAWARAEDLPFLDLTDTLRAHVLDGPRLTYQLDGHWTPAGHQLAARTIEPWLRATRIAP